MTSGIAMHGVRLSMGKHRFAELRHPLVQAFNDYNLLLRPPFRKLLQEGNLSQDYAGVMTRAEVMAVVEQNPARYCPERPDLALAEFRRLIEGFDLFFVHAFET